MKPKPIVSIISIVLSVVLIGVFGTFLIQEIQRSMALSSMTAKLKAESKSSKTPPTAIKLKSSGSAASRHQPHQVNLSSTQAKTNGAPSHQQTDLKKSDATLKKNPSTNVVKSNIKKQTKTIQVVAALANVRKAPGTNQKVQDHLKKGSTVESISQKSINGKTWYEIQAGPKENGWVSSEISKLVDKPEVLLNAPIIDQLPELERGCEVTSLAMLLGQAGIKTDKMTLAKQIKTLPFEQNGYRSNPNDGFVGDIYSFKKPGLGVYHGPIAALAKKYLGDKVIDLSGKDWSAVEKQLNQGHAVWVIINNTFNKLSENDASWYTWNTEEGTIRVTYREHSVLVTGYSANTVFVNDPLSGVKNQAHNKEEFIAAWKQMGSQAVSY